jgi:methyltransferase (TIGR00027 family)
MEHTSARLYLGHKEMSFDHSENAIASTAYWMAAIRAQESERVDRLFDDPWAALLAGQVGRDWLDRIDVVQARLERMSQDYRIALQWGKSGQMWGKPVLRFETTIPENPASAFARNAENPTEIGVVIRTKFFDDFLLHAAREHHIPQVVMLASGMDTRAFRLRWPMHTRLFEIDQPELLLHKRQVLSAAGASLNCWRRSIGADLAEGHWSGTLLRAGFDPHQTSVWLIEGLLPYLPEEVVLHLLDKVTALSAPGSWLGLTPVNGAMFTSPATRILLKFMQEAGIPCLSAMDDPEALLAQRGWAATVVQPGEESANFDRWPYPVIPRSVPNVPRTWFITAIKQSSKMSSSLKAQPKKLSGKNPHSHPLR